MRITYLLLLPFFFACQSAAKQEEKVELQIEILSFDATVSSSFRGISVLDSQTVWISGSNGVIVRTLDKGENWELIPAPDQDSLDFRDVHAFSKDRAIVSSAGFPARIYSTENAGKDWRLVYENKDSSAFLNSIHFRDKLNGLVLGDRLNNYHFVLATNDGGKSWTRIDSSLLPKPLAIEHGFAASGSCIANVKDNYVIALGGEKSRVFHGNLQKSWEAVDFNIADSSASSGIYSIASSNKQLIVVGGDYTKTDDKHSAYLSADEGWSWKAGGELSGYRSVVDYCQHTKIWLAAGTNGIDCSLNEGLRWEKIAKINLNTLQFDDASGICYAAGPKGKLYRIEINL